MIRSLLLPAQLQRIILFSPIHDKCKRVHAICLSVSLRACNWCVCVCVCVLVCMPSVLQCWQVEARVCLHSEISQISYCLCSFSIHALWFTTPRASYTNDVAFSEGFLTELKHAPLVTRTMTLLGLEDLFGFCCCCCKRRRTRDTFIVTSVHSLCSRRC